MGRIKTMLVKRVARELFQHAEDKITTDFGENKKVVEEQLTVSSKKLRNIVAGYVTRLKKSGDTNFSLS